MALGLLMLSVGLFVFVLQRATVLTFEVFGEGNTEAAAIEEHELVELANQKRIALSNLKEMELDFETGKVGERDYKRLRKIILGETVQIMERLDAVRSSLKYGPRIKEDLAKTELLAPPPLATPPTPKEAAPQGGADEASAANTLKALRGQLAESGVQCGNCSEWLLGSERFCPSCGSAQSAAGAKS